MAKLLKSLSKLTQRRPLKRTNSLENLYVKEEEGPKVTRKRSYSFDISSILMNDESNIGQRSSDFVEKILDLKNKIRQGIQRKKSEKNRSRVSGDFLQYICKTFCTEKPEKSSTSRFIVDNLKSAILNTIENKDDIAHIWVGRQDKTSHDIDTVVIVTRSSKSYNLGDKIWGLKILVRCIDTCSDEAANLLIYDTNDSIGSLSGKLTESDIKSLFHRHSNITLINTSNVCSIGYKSKTNAKIEWIPSIVIYCHIKGVIPIGEEAFPKSIGGHRVDVREAVCNFAVKPVQLSEKIGTEGSTRFGTLGGFVTLQNPERQLFLTCAHVLFPINQLKNEKLNEDIKEKEINVVDKDGHQLGKVHKAVFKHGHERDVSIDAALVEIIDQYRYARNGKFAVISPEEISKTGFSEYNMPRFDNGEMEQVTQSNFRQQALKVGAKSGLTIGSLKIGNSCARILYYDIQVGNYFSTTFYKQMEVIPQLDYSQTSESREPFLDNGDSGSFVYLIAHPEPVVLKCIGLAFAKTSHGTCLMTPIDKVFEALGLPFNCLSKFAKEDTQRGNISDILSKLEDISNKMATKEDFKKMNGEISSMKQKFSSTEASVKVLLEKSGIEITHL
ncbi:uncharacterized protein LOC134251817 [Saccostrea cucullata]|uniref:uncharacterized protein LOC134251817 n=1 Tax=Saccostrea cuccullata TaxID=36930 RepID=UPI002ED038C9